MVLVGAKPSFDSSLVPPCAVLSISRASSRNRACIAGAWHANTGDFQPSAHSSDVLISGAFERQIKAISIACHYHMVYFGTSRLHPSLDFWGSRDFPPNFSRDAVMIHRARMRMSALNFFADDKCCTITSSLKRNTKPALCFLQERLGHSDLKTTMI